MANPAINGLQYDTQTPNARSYWSACAPIKESLSLSSHRIFHRKETLYCTGDVFEGIYILKSGSAKSVIHSKGGDEYVANFYLPGDIMGIEGFSQHSYQHTLEFLETSSVVLFKEAEIHHLIKTSDKFRNDLLQQMGSALLLEEERQLARREYSSKQRVAKFLLAYANRLKASGLCHETFRLTMSRTDIANHTGMVIETASRIFKQLQQDNLIFVKHRNVHMLDELGLRRSLKRSKEKVID